MHSFTGGSDGAAPKAGVVEGSDGNFHGTTYQGGASGLGTVFMVTPSGTETVVHSFTGGSSDGANSYAGVILGSDGNFYGTTSQAAATVMALSSSSRRAEPRALCTPLPGAAATAHSPGPA